ncbi:MAG TPA: hypothetical protein DIT58_15730 [Porticoccaceae bacterium]|nr:hypothetical protein [Porticoccaceae bacterium]
MQALYKIADIVHSALFGMGRLREEDKKKHFWLSFALVPAIYPWTSLAFATVVVLLLGLLKECYDHRFGTGFCWYDMSANGMGVSAGVAFAWSLTQMGHALF